MMSLSVLNIPMIEVLKVWGELVECLHGANGYGGDTAELYAYRFAGDSPSRRLLDKSVRGEADAAAALEARQALHSLLSIFEGVYGARCTVNGMSLMLWHSMKNKEPFDHRVHVKVSASAKES